MDRVYFWNKLDVLREELNSNESAYSLVRKMKEKQSRSSEENTVYSVKGSSKEEVIKKIEELIIQFLESLSLGELPKFSFNRRGTFDNTRFTNERGIEMLNNVASHEVSLLNDRSLKKHSIIMNCLSVCYTLLQNDKYATKRDIYYSNVNFFKSQQVVDEAISNISCMLCVPRYSLHVLSSSKGFVGGALTFKDSEKNTINCDVGEGVQIPCHIDGLHDFKSPAKYVLIVEKEAIYERLMEEKLCEKLGPCIILTGKGFPDVNTRMLVQTLWKKLCIPIFALVDADPHGIEIMLVYKFGSKALSHESSYLTCPIIRWLGVFPKDVDDVNIKEDQLIKLSENDRKKAIDLTKRSYIRNNQQLLEQLNIIISKGTKAEIECLDSISRSFLTDIYLPHKIRTGDWI